MARPVIAVSRVERPSSATASPPVDPAFRVSQGTDLIVEGGKGITWIF